MTHRPSGSHSSNGSAAVVGEMGERAAGEGEGEGERGSMAMVGVGSGHRSGSGSRTRSMLVDLSQHSPMHGSFDLNGPSTSSSAPRISPSLSRGRPLGSPGLASPRPGSLVDGQAAYVPPAAIMEANDYEFLARRSRAFDLQDPPAGTKRGRKG